MSTKDYSFRQEHSIASALGWEVVSGSGARPCVPGDIISDDWLGECKTHVDSGKPIAFNYKVWLKICDEAAMKHRSPALFVDDGSQSLANTWVLCYYHTISGHELFKIAYPKATIPNISATLQYFTDLVQSAKPLLGRSYEYVIIVHKWHNDNVAIMPFDTFKEICQ